MWLSCSSRKGANANAAPATAAPPSPARAPAPADRRPRTPARRRTGRPGRSETPPPRRPIRAAPPARIRPGRRRRRACLRGARTGSTERSPAAGARGVAVPGDLPRLWQGIPRSLGMWSPRCRTSGQCMTTASRRSRGEHNQLARRDPLTSLGHPRYACRVAPRDQRSSHSIRVAGFARCGTGYSLTSTYWNGYMDGAVRSAKRAAREVLDRL